MEKINIAASTRTEFSKSARGTMRRSGVVPGIFYSRNHQPIAIAIPENTINPLVFTSDTHIINLTLEQGNEFECIIKDIQFDPITDRVIHFDLQGIIEGEKLEIEVPVVMKGSSIGVRDGGLLQQFLHKLLIECLPADIPEHIEVDITELKMGQAIHVNAVSVPNLTILNPSETVIVSVTHPRSAVEAAVPTGEEPTEPEVIAKGKEKQEEE